MLSRSVFEVSNPQVDRGGSRALEVDVGFFRVRTVEMGPQGGSRYEHPPPSPANVGQCNHIAIPGPILVRKAIIQKVRDESEDFGRNTADWCKPVPQASGIGSGRGSLERPSRDHRPGVRYRLATTQKAISSNGPTSALSAVVSAILKKPISVIRRGVLYHSKRTLR